MRHNKFSQIPNLDNELDLIVEDLTVLSGKKVTAFPPVSQIPELARFIKKGSDGYYREYKKIDGELLVAGVDTNGLVIWVKEATQYGS